MPTRTTNSKQQALNTFGVKRHLKWFLSMRKFLTTLIIMAIKFINALCCNCYLVSLLGAYSECVLRAGEAGVDWQGVATPTRASSFVAAGQVQPGQRHHWQSPEHKPGSRRSDWRRHKRWPGTQESWRRIRYGTPIPTDTRGLIQFQFHQFIYLDKTKHKCQGHVGTSRHHTNIHDRVVIAVQ